MLILSRKKEEQIAIGDNVIITVENVVGNQVKLSIDALEEILVLREELLDDDQ